MKLLQNSQSSLSSSGESVSYAAVLIKGISNLLMSQKTASRAIPTYPPQSLQNQTYFQMG